MYGSRSGISPVMATVILVAIAIVIAIAVAFWATGLVGVFTRFEKLEITAAYYDPNQKGIILKVRNTGSATATIDDIYVNGIPGAGTNMTGTLTLIPGNSTTILVKSPPSAVGNQFVSGVTYEVAVHTASGKTYPAAVQIP
ncbi:MAG: hypothetical protein J7L17_02350 [Thaumarchaeota archaeon]|nr:hypothetical protein [Nitrososphaerota archaeon]